MSWADLNVSYTNGDVTGVNESQLLMWRYNGSNWNLVASPNGVDTAQNVVFANVTSFGMLAPLETALVADAGANISVDEGDSVSFDASGSSDKERIVSYEWDFGDGATASGVQVSHTYDSPGSYVVTLTVSDAAGNSDTDTVVVTVQAGETVTTTTQERTSTTTTSEDPSQQTTTPSGDGAGFGIVATLVALGSLLAVSRYW